MAFIHTKQKYLDENGAELIIPAASADSETCKAAQQLAQKIFTALECEGMARVDLFLEKHTGKLWFMKSIHSLDLLPSACTQSYWPLQAFPILIY